MKQTNNAIKFLLAQYRAIFKQAYLKGLVSAVVLTTGLAAGAAANAATTALDVLGSGDYDVSSSGSKVADTPEANDIWTGKLTINASGTSTITATTNPVVINADGNNGSLEITGTGNELILSGSASTATLTANLATIDVKDSGSLTLDASNADVTLTASTLTLSGNASITLSGDGSGKAALLDLSNGELTVTGDDASTLSVGKSSTLKIKADNLTTVLGDGLVKLDVTGEDSKEATLAIAGNATLKADDFVADDTAGLHIGSHATLDAENLTISGTAISNMSGTISATNLTFNSENGITLNTGSYEFTDALNGTAEVKVAGDAKMALGSNVNSSITATSSNPITVEGDTSVNNNAVITVGNDSTLGSVTISGSNAASLTFTDGTSLNMVSGSVTVSGNSATNTSTLDLSAGTLSYTGENKASIQVKDFGSITIKGADLSTALASENGQFGLMVSGNGSNAATANVSGSLDVAAGKFVADATSAGGIQLGTNSTLNVSETLTIKGNSATTVDHISTAKIEANSLAFNGGTSYTVKSGNFTVTEGLTADNAVTFSGSKVALGSDVSGKFTFDDSAEASVTDKVSTVSGGSITLGGNGTGTLKVQSTDGTDTALTFSEGTSLVVTNGNVTVSGTGALLDLSNGTLTTGTNAATLTVSGGAELKVKSEDLSNLDASTKLSVSSASTDSSTLTSVGNLTLDEAKFVAQNSNGIYVGTNGKFNVDGTLTINDAATPDGINLSSVSGTVSASTLTFSGDKTKGVTVSGNGTTTALEATIALNSNGALTVSNLALNLNGTSGKINNTLTAGTGATVAVNGAWTTTKKINISNDGKFVVNDKGSLTASQIAADDNATGKFTVNKGGVLTVNGIDTSGNTPAIEAGTAGFYGFSLTDKTVDINGGKFVIGSIAAGGILDNRDDWSTEANGDTPAKDVLANFGEYNITNAGILQIDFASGTAISLDELATLKNELAGATDGVLSDGVLNIGQADLTGITGEGGIINDQGEITAEDYDKVAGSIGDTQIEAIMNSQITGVGSTIYGGHVGSLKLTGDSVTILNNASLNKADSNGNLISKANGTVGDATISSGKDFALNQNGNVGNITLTAGEDGDLTTFNINAANKVTSIDGGDFTKVVVGVSGDATVTNDITAAELENNNKLTVTSGDITTEKFTNKGTASLATGSLTSTELTNASVLSVKTDVTTSKFADTAESTLSAESVTIDNSKQTGKPVASTVAGKIIVSDTFNLTGVGSADDSRATVAGTVTADKGSVSLNNADIAETGVVSAKKATLSGLVVIDGQFAVSDTTTITGNVLFNHSNQLNEINLAGTGDYGFAVENGAVVIAEKITGNTGASISVGTDDEVENKSATGYLQVNDQLNLNGASLLVDPAYDEKASLVAVGRLTGTKNKEDVGIFDGNVFVGQNAALGVGVTLAELQETLSQFMVDGAFLDPANDDNASYGAMLYLNKPVSISDKNNIILTTETQTDFENTLTVAPNTIYFGDGTALAVNTNYAKDNEAYIKFVTIDSEGKTKDTTGNLIADGGEIVLFGDTYKKTYQLFDKKTAATIKDSQGNASEINVISANGFLFGILDEKSDGSVSLSINEEMAGVFLANASTPVQETIRAYINGYNGEYDLEAGEEIPEGAYLGSYDKKGNFVQNEYNNYFLSQVVLGGNAADVEKVARLGVYGGTAQAALTAGATTYEAVAGRMGVGAQNGNITFADNGQGAGLWVTPVYKNHDSDGFGAQGLSYGADLDLYGVALGADYTLENGLRVGAAFNVGSGDADGQGAGAGVSNDFDYYGFTVYGGFTMDQLSVVADVSYTAVDNDVEANTGVEKVSASMDSSNLSFGVTAQYAFDMNGVSVTPHAGLRYTNIDLDDYTVRGSADIAKYSADSASVFSIPVGVTFAKEITSGAWTIKPALDLTLTANMGDDSVDGSVTWAGVENLKTNLESEVIDSFTYGAALGVSAKSGNMSFGFGVNYTGASSADEYGVSANARFVF